MADPETIEVHGQRIAGIAGILGIVSPSIALAILPIWDFPATRSSGAQLSEFVVAHQSALQAVMVFNTLGVTLWMVFGAGVWLRLRRTPNADGLLTTCFAFGLVSFVTLLMAGFVAFDVLVYRTPDPAYARVLYDLSFGLLAMSGPPTAIALGSYAVIGFRGASSTDVTTVTAGIAAVMHVVLLASFVVPDGALSLEGLTIVIIPALLFAWILTTAIRMVVDDLE